LEEEDLTRIPVPMPTQRQPLTPVPRKSFSVATVQPHKTTVSCPQVWALLGRGKSAAEAAKSLRTTVERVSSCEQQVGRGRVRG
jgi:hypothetical protein